jgi:flagellar hook-associated protein 1 FlgK
MSSIFSCFQIGQQALQAQQFGLQITQKNIANANTPGYSQERADFIPGNPSGISSMGVQAFRDRFLDYRISQELQGQGAQQSLFTSLQQVEAYVNENGGQGLQTALSGFFNSFSDLANSPEDMNLRQKVLAKAGDLADQFNRISSKVQSVQMSADLQVSDTVGEVNAITAKIAGLNATIARVNGSNSQDEASAKDQRQQLMDQLSGLVDLTYFETETGALTVTTRQGSLLVVGDQNHQMDAANSPGTSFLQISVDGKDITSQIQSGKLGGLLTARDQSIPAYLGRLDDLAAGIIKRVNAQHALGDDASGNAGGALFVPFTPIVPGSNAGAARTMALAISDPTLVAAARSGSGIGSNANALAMAGIKDEMLFSGGSATADQYYSGLIFNLGNDLQSAQNGAKTQDQLLVQLQNQRDSFSGVNLDDEAVNIVRYQKAYEASARFVSTLNTLTEQLLQILGA